MLRWKIFPVGDSCPILSSSVLGHHKSSSGSSSSSGHSPSSDTRLPVVNEKSPQSIIMDAPLASLGKKSTISTTGKYWKRMPANGAGGNIFSMEDRRGLRSLGGSSIMSGMSEHHPYSDAGSCTSSPVYAELDPSVAGSCHTPTMIGPAGGGSSILSSSFSPYAFSGTPPSNTYSEVPENVLQLRGHLVHLGHNAHHHHHPHHHQQQQPHGMSPSPLLTDSSTYDNAAYLPASSQQPFLSNNGNQYATRSLRRLAAQRSAVLSANNAAGQVSTPLLAGHPYHVQPYAGTLHHPHQHLQSTPIVSSSPGNNPNGHFQFLTGGRPLKKPRPSANHNTQQQTSFAYRTGPRGHLQQSGMLNHYVSNQDGDLMLTDDQTQLTSPPAAYGGVGNFGGGGGNGGGPFAAYLDSSSNGSSNRKSSSSSQYTEMPLLQNSNFNSTTGAPMNSGGAGGHYRMSATCSANDLNSAASSSSTGSTGNGGGACGNHITNSTSSANSSTSLKRPLPPVPGMTTTNTGHVRL